MKFAILEHHDPRLGRHIDLLLEVPGSDDLRTWRMAKPPSLVSQPAEEISRHRRAYLTYQGPVYPDRGYVQSWDRGWYEALIDRPGIIRIRCRGTRGAGILELVGDAVDESAPWQCRWTATFR